MTNPLRSFRMPSCIAMMAMLLLPLASISAQQFEVVQIVDPKLHTAKNNTLSRELVAAAHIGDKIVLHFDAAAGYEHVSSRVDDFMTLGWMNVAKGPRRHTYSVMITATTASKAPRGSELYADFYGVLRRTGNGGGTGGGGGKGSGGKDEEKLDWDFRGHFRVFNDHEGVGSDDKRNPVGKLVSDKTHARQETSGSATYSYTESGGKKSVTFKGTLVDQTDNFQGTGMFVHAFAIHADTSVPKLDSVVPNQPSPQDKNVKVVYAYFTAPDVTYGGVANPDTILINDFSLGATAAAAQKALAESSTAAAKAEADRKALDTALKSAEKDLADAQAKAQQERDRLLKPYVDAVNKATTPQQKAAAQATLNAAKQQVDTAPSMKPLLAAVAAAQAKVDALRQQRDAAKQAENRADDAMQKAYDAYEPYEFIQKAWDKELPTLIEHEEGHRRVLYHFVDKATDWLNHLRVWGYAPTQARAEELGAVHYRSLRIRKEAELNHLNVIYQKIYEQATQHGFTQKNWNWNNSGLP